MNYEELREKERELAKALIEVREQLEKMDEEKALELLQTAINSLKEFEELTDNGFNCELEIYCEECEKEFDAYTSIGDIIQSLRDLKEREF
jgi:hypothetical protein